VRLRAYDRESREPELPRRRLVVKVLDPDRLHCRADGILLGDAVAQRRLMNLHAG